MSNARARSRRLARMAAPLVLVGSAVVPLAAAGLAAPAHAATTKIDIKNFSYSNPGLKIAVGDKVTWTNLDKPPHDATATAGPEKFKSPTLATGQSWSYTFTKPGTYSYICSIHPQMTASVIVAKPAVKKPAAKPTAVKPAAKQAPAAKPAAAKPAADKAKAKPPAAKPAAVKPAAEKAAPAKPAPRKPPVAKPAAVRGSNGPR